MLMVAVIIALNGFGFVGHNPIPTYVTGGLDSKQIVSQSKIEYDYLPFYSLMSTVFITKDKGWARQFSQSHRCHSSYHFTLFPHM